MEKKNILLVIIALVVVSLACGLLGGNNNSTTATNNGARGDNLSTPTTAQAIQANTPSPSEEQSQELPPFSYIEFYNAGVENGLWTEEDGLLKMMQYIVGETSPEALPDVENVVDLEANGILQLSREYLAQPDPDPEIAAKLERIINIMFPPLEVLEQISRPTSTLPYNKLASISPMAARQEQDACEDLALAGYDPEELSNAEEFAEAGINPFAEYFGDCYVYVERVLDAQVFRVYYPFWWEGDEEREARILLSLDALAESSMGYAAMPGLSVGDIYIAFAVAPWGTVKGFSNDFNTETEACPIAMLPLSDDYAGEKYKQIIAHEIFHCVQAWSFPNQRPYETHTWWLEGSAEYYSNLIYPNANLEFRANERLIPRSAQFSIFQMTYENFAFFQFMGNKYTTPVLTQILYSISSSNTPEGQEEALRAVANIDENFNLFAVEYLSSGILDSGGERIKSEDPTPNGTRTIDEVGEIEFAVQPFVAMRYTADYKQEKRFLQNSDNPNDVQLSGAEYTLRQNIDAWSNLPPELRSKCKEDVRYLYVITSTQDFYSSYKINVTLAEKAECDPCLLGTWDVDPVSYANAMKKIMAQGGADVGLIVEGHMYLQFLTEGKALTQREDFGITGNGIVTATLNGSGDGTYTANGEELTVFNFVDNTDSVGIGFFGAPDPNPFTGPMLNEGNTPQNETAQYVCEQDDLTITIPELGDVLFHRVDKILATPVPTAAPPDQPQP